MKKSELEKILIYRPEKGDFLWRIPRSTRTVGSPAGTYFSQRGGAYARIKIYGKYYLVHRLVWLMERGELPAAPLDHIDGNGWNNHISNLRECTLSQNKANSRSYKNNKSGVKGVFREGRGWRVSIQRDGRRHYIGRFKTKEEAAAAYLEAAQRLFGEFARAA